MRQEQRRAVYDLLYYAKMRRDTPRNLRTSVPLMRFFVTPRLIAIASPGWFLAFLHWWGANDVAQLPPMAAPAHAA